MDFDSFIDQAWTDHATDAAAVAARLQAEGLPLLTAAAQIPRFAHLAAHVHGDHLGHWQDGVHFQQQLAALPFCPAEGDTPAALRRYTACLSLAAGTHDERPALAESDRIRVTAMTAAALAAHDATRAAALLQEALADAETSGLPGNSPHARALAVTGNNLAATLEELPERSAAERALMILAAQTGRRFWAIAGTWLETERAEHRLAMTWLQAGDLVQARQHAQQCLEIVAANDGASLERFFGWEALGRIERAAANPAAHAQALAQAGAAFAALDDGDRSWCQASLDALKVV